MGDQANLLSQDGALERSSHMGMPPGPMVFVSLSFQLLGGPGTTPFLTRSGIRQDTRDYGVPAFT